MKFALVCNRSAKVDLVYPASIRRRIDALGGLVPGVIAGADLPGREDLAGVEAIFSTWGMPVLGEAELASLPKLGAVFYAAGSVRGFAPPLLERGIRVFSAWAANGIPVAEFALAQILLALKGYWRNVREYTAGTGSFQGPGAYGATVALIGYGQVARHLRRFLRAHRLQVVVVDPYLSAAEAAAEEVETVSLEEAFARAQVVSNHLPNLPATRGLISADLLARLQEHATFINTGRGASVDEPALAALCRARPDLTALLDVTDHPPGPDCPYRDLPNVVMSGHIAGSINDECQRMAEWLVDEYERWRDGGELRYEVTPERLATMA